MTKIIGAVVREGRIEADAPPDWPDGTEVHIYLVCRAGLTADHCGVNGAELAVIENRRAKDVVERKQQAKPQAGDE